VYTKQRTMDRLLNRPLTRESKKKLREDIDKVVETVARVQNKCDLFEEAMVEMYGEVQTLKNVIADMKKPAAARKPQKCTMCGLEGHNARNSRYHPAQVVHVPGGLTVAHV